MEVLYLGTLIFVLSIHLANQERLYFGDTRYIKPPPRPVVISRSLPKKTSNPYYRPTSPYYKPPTYKTTPHTPIYKTTPYKPPVYTPSTYKPPVYYSPKNKPPVYQTSTYKPHVRKPPVYKPPTYKPPIIIHHADHSGLKAVLNVNDQHRGNYGSYGYWNVDCNKDRHHHRWISAIWDDYHNFGDLDKVKCNGIQDGVSLDLSDNYIINFTDYKHHHQEWNCPPGYVLTALYDYNYGFPEVSLGKCTAISYGSIDQLKVKTIYTDGQSGGNYGPYQPWRVECPYQYAAVGIKKHHSTIKALDCVHVIPKHKYK